MKVLWLLALLTIPFTFAYADTATIFSSNDADNNQPRTIPSVSSSCGTAETTDGGGGIQIYKGENDASDYCFVEFHEFDTSSLGNNISVSSITFNYVVNSVSNAINCAYIEVLDPESLSLFQAWDVIFSTGTEYYSGAECTTAGAKAITLGSVANDRLEVVAETGGNFGLGWRFDDMTRDTNDHYIVGETSPYPSITVTYTRNSDVVDVGQATPCFLNYTAGYEMWENCGYDEDYLQAALLPWEWITGGYFSLVIASIIILFTYLKYHKVVYPIITGILFLPISYFIFPGSFLSFAVLMVGLAVGILIWKVFIRQTKEFD